MVEAHTETVLNSANLILYSLFYILKLKSKTNCPLKSKTCYHILKNWRQTWQLSGV